MLFTAFRIFLWKHYKSISSTWLFTLITIVLIIGWPWMLLILDAIIRFPDLVVMATVIYMFSMVNIVVVPMVEEKALGIREFLRIATNYHQLNLISYYVLNLLLGVSMYGIIVLLCNIYGIMLSSNYWALFLILLFVASAIAYAFLVSVLFNDTFYARLAGYLLLLMPMLLPLFESMYWLSPLFAGNLFFDGCRLIEHDVDSIFEHHPSTILKFNLFQIWCIITADLVAYVLLYTYLGHVFPGAYGTPMPFYFPALWLMRRFGDNVATNDGRTDTERQGTIGSSRCAEPVVRVRALSKDFGHLFGKKNRAVNNVDMDICANQITVLLGHNGAGKTTTMSIISGVIPKTSGEISVNGERDVNKYRKDIGYCPQHNVFLPYLTCMEHLIFFGILRGFSNGEAREKSRDLLDRLMLQSKANEYGKNLSGGMKRRLCLGVALIGDTKIAILDEPSSGLDPKSRRELWNILIEMRKQNTIMITTHYMEEAEALADYICIMSRGEILCHGTAQQLKRRYADGYVLKLLTTDHFDVGQTMERLLKHIPGAKVKSYVKPTINVTLPYNSLDKYSDALAELESASSQLGIDSFALSNASLEDVFLKSDPLQHSPDGPDSLITKHDFPANNSSSPPGGLWIRQVVAIIYKKLIYVRRNWMRLLACVIIVIIFVVITVFTMDDTEENPTNIMLTSIGMFLYMLYYASMPFAENHTEFKQLQIIPSSLYWATYYAFDVAQHLLICLLLFCVHVACDRKKSFTPYEHGKVVCVYAIYGVTYLPLLYVLAHLYGSITSLFSFLSYMHIVSTCPWVYFLMMSPKDFQQYAGWISILYVVPDYALKHSIYVLIYGYLDNPVDDPISGLRLYYTVALIVVMFAVLIFLLEHIYRRDAVARVLRTIWRAFKCCKTIVYMPAVQNTKPTADVERERDQTAAVVKAHTQADYAIVVTKLRKEYDGVAVVRGVNFVVPRGECFGLLGMNGAGKTTTFKMMVRHLTITEGAIYFNGLNSRSQESRYRYQFGYCPQTDALNSWMTAHETLKYMGLARGTSWGKVNDQVRRLMLNTDLAVYANVTVKKMSGGTKRKLNTAMAIQCDPMLVFLDEPSTGVDPSSRRFMWACIQECQRQNKNIVLTSHSMDECEFLCNRLAIMDRGQLNCIGPIQQLKRSFALGFLVIVHLRDGQAGSTGAAQMRQAVLDRFQCVLREEYGNQLTFLAQNTNIVWSEVCKSMVAVQQQFDSVVEDISLSESSLEDIFLKIARQSDSLQNV